MKDQKEEIPLRIACYLRVSTEEQVDKYGLEAQKGAIDGVILSRGRLKNGNGAAVLAGEQYIYKDEGVSGTDEIDQRPGFTQLKEDILNSPPGKRPFDVVAVYKIDRFARKLRILMEVVEFLQEHDIGFVSATENIDTSSPFGRAMLHILGVIAELERETILERTQRGKDLAIHSGVYMGANAPFGYKKDKEGRLEILSEEAKVVEQIFDYFTVNKFPPQKIADILTQEEILSPDASAVMYNKRKGSTKKRNKLNLWRGEKVRSILSDEVYIGKRYYSKSKHGKEIPTDQRVPLEYTHDSIILNHIFMLAQDELKKLSNHATLTKKKIDNHIYLLSGLLKCDHCRNLEGVTTSEYMSWTGAKDKINSNPEQYSYHYHCNRKNIKKYSFLCPVVPIPGNALEDYVVNFVTSLLKDPQGVFEYQHGLRSNKLSIKQYTQSKEQFIKLLKSIPSRKETLLEQHEIKAIDTPTLTAKLQELEQKKSMYEKGIDEADFRLSQIKLSSGYADSLSLYSEKYNKIIENTLNDRRELYELIHALISQIVIYSRNKTSGDVIAGRKKEGQFIPERIEIHFNLPQILMRQFYRHEFGVKLGNL